MVRWVNKLRTHLLSAQGLLWDTHMPWCLLLPLLGAPFPIFFSGDCLSLGQNLAQWVCFQGVFLASREEKPWSRLGSKIHFGGGRKNPGVRAGGCGFSLRSCLQPWQWRWQIPWCSASLSGHPSTRGDDAYHTTWSSTCLSFRNIYWSPLKHQALFWALAKVWWTRWTECLL